MYGSTEATSRMAYMPANLNKKHPESVGFAIPGGKLWLQDKKNKKITSTNTVGEIVYKGSNVCLGYANSKKKEAQISGLISELKPLVKDIGDATLIVPLIKEYRVSK